MSLDTKQEGENNSTTTETQEEEDLTEEQLGSFGPAVATYSPQLKNDPKEPTRQRIVYFLLGIMAVLLVLPFCMVAFGSKDIMTDKLWEYVHVAFPALTGLLGTAIGFYFERNSR